MYKNSIGYFGSLVYDCTNVKYIFIKINGIMKKRNRPQGAVFILSLLREEEEKSSFPSREGKERSGRGVLL
jgi:hypothetical protein